VIFCAKKVPRFAVTHNSASTDAMGTSRSDHLAAIHFFRLICERYERGSIVLVASSNISDLSVLNRAVERRSADAQDTPDVTRALVVRQHLLRLANLCRRKLAPWSHAMGKCE